MSDDEDRESDEEDVTLRQQETQVTNSGRAYTFKLELVRGEDPKAFHVSVKLFTRQGGTSDTSKEEKVGYLSGFLLERPNPYFYVTADALDEELQLLAVTFCSSNGEANRVKHPCLQKSNNCIYRGGFFHINLMEIRRAHQGKDLGLRMIHEALSFLGKDWTLAVLIPSTLSYSGCQWPENYRINGGTPRPRFSDETPQEKQEIKMGKLKLMRHYARMGFVQAFKGDPDRCDAWFLTSQHYFPQGSLDHSSAIGRWLSKEAAEKIDIYTKPEKHVPTGLDKELQKVIGTTGHVKQEIRAIEDLVRRGASIHGSRLLFLMTASLEADDSRKIFDALVRLGGNVNEPDEFGNTPLHVAACTMKPQAIRYLVCAGANVQTTNMRGNTALKNLQDHLENMHDFNAAYGLPIREVDVVPKYESYHALMPQNMRSLLISDWLSPRMRCMIETTAEIICGVIEESSDYFESNKPLPLSQFVLFQRGLEYIPISVFSCNPDGFFKSFNDAWGMIFQAIYALTKKRKVPTVQCVSEALQNGVDVPNFDSRKYQHFLQKGGKIEYALDATFHITETVLVEGDNYWEYTMIEDEMEALPTNPLDNAFDVAYFMCIDRGGGSLTSRGPYNVLRFYDSDGDN